MHRFQGLKGQNNGQNCYAETIQDYQAKRRSIWRRNLQAIQEMNILVYGVPLIHRTSHNFVVERSLSKFSV